MVVNIANVVIANDRIVVVTLLMMLMLGRTQLFGLVTVELLHRIIVVAGG